MASIRVNNIMGTSSESPADMATKICDNVLTVSDTFFGSSLVSLGSISEPEGRLGHVLIQTKFLVRTLQIKAPPERLLLVEGLHFITSNTKPGQSFLDIFT